MSEKAAKRRGRVYQRGSKWWVDFSRRGKRIRRPLEDVTNEQQAWDALETMRSEARKGRRVDLERVRWSNLSARLLSHHEAKGTKPRTLARWKQVLAHLDGFFGEERAEDIPEHVDDYVALRRKQGAAPASIRMELAVLAQAFRVARLPRPDLPAVEVDNVRRAFFEQHEVERVLQRLPADLRAVVQFGYATGWRKQSCLGLRWKDVDLAGGVVRLAPGVKRNDRGAVFPFGAHPVLREVLLEQRERTTALERATGRIVQWVFHRNGDPIRDMDDAWRSACREAGLPGRKFHDLRRSAALNLRRRGLSETDVMDACGWKTRAMFQRYQVADDSGLVERFGRAYGTNAAQATIPGVSGASR